MCSNLMNFYYPLIDPEQCSAPIVIAAAANMKFSCLTIHLASTML